jgi:DNA-binding XRE family transcriptional regulator
MIGLTSRAMPIAPDADATNDNMACSKGILVGSALVSSACSTTSPKFEDFCCNAKVVAYMLVHIVSVYLKLGVMHVSRNPDLMSAFAIEMKARRNTLGISQEELAHRADVDRTFVARIETAQNQPTLSVLFRLCEGLGVAPEDMIEQTRRRLARGKTGAKRMD